MNGKATRRRARKILIPAALLLAAPHAGSTQAASLVPPPSGPCSLENTARATIAKIEPNLDIALADGRVLTLAGLDPTHDTPAQPRLAAEARDKLAAWLDGREVAFRLASGAIRSMRCSQAATAPLSLIPRAAWCSSKARP
jgi:hypothetical protein